MGCRKNTKAIIIFLMIIILFLPTNVFAKSDENETLIIMVDKISFDEIDELEIEDKSIGLMNLKTRKPYSEDSLYLSLNLGRKVSKKEIEDKELDLEYIGDVLNSEGLFYFGDKDSQIDLLLADIDGNSKGRKNDIEYDDSWLIENVNQSFEENNIIALEYKIDNKKDRLITLEKFIKNNISSKRKIYLIPTKVSEKDGKIINKYLTPIVIFDEISGLLTSESTKREGIIAIEDISVDIKSRYGYSTNTDIGEMIQVDEVKDPFLKIEKKYIDILSLLIIASIFHGMFYLAQGLMLINILKKSGSDFIEKFYLFATNNILISLVLAFFDIQNNIFLYLILAVLINILITNLIYKRECFLSFSFIFTYILIIYGILFNNDIIYNSYIGFNNLIYGARFYGFNNGIVGVFLATSILTTSYIYESRLPKWIRNSLVFLIPVFNIVILSTKIGVNTGGFITSILLFILNTYYYFISKEINIKTIILFILVALIIFGINIYVDSLGNSRSHAVQFLNRIKENGIKELIYMGSHKLKELVRLTIMPPFSLVLIAQIIILNKEYRESSIDIKILLYTSILGFIINDTGNILLIYMLNYLIIRLYFYKGSIFSNN